MFKRKRAAPTSNSKTASKSSAKPKRKRRPGCLQTGLVLVGLTIGCGVIANLVGKPENQPATPTQPTLTLADQRGNSIAIAAAEPSATTAQKV